MSPSLLIVQHAGTQQLLQMDTCAVFFASFLFDFPFARYKHLLPQVESGLLYWGALDYDRVILADQQVL